MRTFVLVDASIRRHTRWPRDWSSDVCSSDLDLNALLASISPNTFANFQPGRAKQMISVTRDGYLIGDGILFFHSTAEDDRVLVGHHILIDWIRFHIEKAQRSEERRVGKEDK